MNHENWYGVFGKSQTVGEKSKENKQGFFQKAEAGKSQNTGQLYSSGAWKSI